MADRLRRQLTAILILLVVLGLIALAWMWVMVPHAPGVLHAVGGVP